MSEKHHFQRLSNRRKEEGKGEQTEAQQKEMCAMGGAIREGLVSQTLTGKNRPEGEKPLRRQ